MLPHQVVALFVARFAVVVAGADDDDADDENNNKMEASISCGQGKCFSSCSPGQFLS